VDLAGLVDKWSYFSCVGGVMLSHVEQMQPHLPYIVNYERAHRS